MSEQKLEQRDKDREREHEEVREMEGKLNAEILRDARSQYAALSAGVEETIIKTLKWRHGFTDERAREYLTEAMKP